MKTALEIYEELKEEYMLGHPNKGINRKVKTGKELVVYAMKVYAEQALDEAAKQAKLQRLPKYDARDYTQYEVDEDSILSIKDQLK